METDTFKRLGSGDQIRKELGRSGTTDDRARQRRLWGPACVHGMVAGGCSLSRMAVQGPCSALAGPQSPLEPLRLDLVAKALSPKG